MSAYRTPLSIVVDDEPPSTLRSPVSSRPPRTTMHYFEEDGVYVFVAENVLSGGYKFIVQFDGLLDEVNLPEPVMNQFRFSDGLASEVFAPVRECVDRLKRLSAARRARSRLRLVRNPRVPRGRPLHRR